MFGFVLGTLCLIGLVVVATRRPAWHRRRFYAFGHRGRHYGACHGGYRARDVANAAFERLDTSPGQEKAIRAALDELDSSLRELSPVLRATRSDVAGALRAETFDRDGLSAALDQKLSQARSLGGVLASTLGRVHEALDADQRRRLARMIEAGPHALLG